jgi:chorismate lyase/3-hydroxybenzoate synthase
MEKTQAGHTRARHRRDTQPVLRQQGASLGLQYLSAGEFAAHQAAAAGNDLGVIAFAGRPPSLRACQEPFAWIDMPVLGGNEIYEVWTSPEPVQRADTHGIGGARNGEVLFGCLQIDDDGDYARASHRAYSRIFDFIDDQDYGHLLRVWNYFPHINDDGDGLERYRQFSIGRHDAFIAKGRPIVSENIPAACALGSRSGPLVIYFLAAKAPGRPVENPRQVSAYRYPARYGPRSPTFSRALLMHGLREAPLFISGTASIVGHETLHAGNATAQTRETLANILAVIKQAAPAGFQPGACSADLHLKAYLRHGEHLTIVSEQVSHTFGPAAQVIYLQADICRADLLVEIEGVYLNGQDKKR